MAARMGRTRRDFLSTIALAPLASALHGRGGKAAPTSAPSGSQATATAPAPSAVRYLGSILDQYHLAFDVYTDSHAAGNNFNARGRLSSMGGDPLIPVMDEAWGQNPHSGTDCIKCEFRVGADNWGGWYLMNGVLRGMERVPSLNWGTYPNAGVDLRGATKLTFWARGATGGERVEFFCLGVGRNADTGFAMEHYPDSSPKASTGYVSLSPDWREYTIDLTARDLSYALGGFGWVSSASRNQNRHITFFLDDIRYDKARPSEPRFAVSYQTIRSSHDFDVVLRNVAFVYDNAVALLAFLSTADVERARLVADALVYAQEHDRYYDDGRLRNAYQGGELILPPGWTPNGRDGTVRMPGWYDPTQAQWFEDRFQVSTHTGNVAWAMIGLLAMYRRTRGAQYLRAAERMGEWVERNCRSARGPGGYTGGFEGWEPDPDPLTYKATEHNIDLYAAFGRLHEITGDGQWRERSEHAKAFVLSMWDSADGKFWTGTDLDGVNINREVIPVDVQAWTVLALRDEGRSYRRALDYAEAHLRVGNGFDFNQDRDGIWYEGTAQMAAAYAQIAETSRATAIVDFLKTAQLPDGALPAANRDELTTGFLLSSGQPWFYYRRSHIAATAWLVLAETGANPFWL